MLPGEKIAIKKNVVTLSVSEYLCSHFHSFSVWEPPAIAWSNTILISSNWILFDVVEYS